MAKINALEISRIANGAIQERLDRELLKVAANIMDPNTDQTKPRKLQLNLVLTPNKDGETVSLEVGIKKTLVEADVIPATLLVGRDMTGHVSMRELKSSAPGQEYIDPDDGVLKHDDGEPVTDDGSSAGVIDFNKNKKEAN
jgi:hypothetical protein